MLHGAKGRALVVEDEANVRWMIADALLSQGYEVLVAADGVEALKAVAEADFVFLDLDMPKMSGEDFVAWLRRYGDFIPVVICTAWEDRARKLKADPEMDIAHILLKPCRLEEIVAKADDCAAKAKDLSYIEEASTAVREFVSKHTDIRRLE